MDFESIRKIIEPFADNQSALKALQSVFRANGFSYDGGLDKMIYDIDGAVRNLQEASFGLAQGNVTINGFASQVAKVAEREGMEFDANPDPAGFGEAMMAGAGLSS